MKIRPFLLLTLLPLSLHSAELEAPDGNTLDFFGSSACLSGNIALVGAHENDEKGKDSGAAYLFLNEDHGKLSATKLTASDGTIGHAFGSSVSLSGNTVLVGARHGNGNTSYCGSAYVFANLNSGSPSQYKLAAPNGEKLDFFGASVSLSGSTALVGAYGVDTVGSSSGAAYVFVNADTTSPTPYKLSPSGALGGGMFGFSVSLSGSTALVGAPAREVSDFSGKVPTPGSAYVFVHVDTASPVQYKLAASDGIGDNYFGSSVSLSGNTALVGAPGDDGKGDNSGSAYVFTNAASGSPKQYKLTASDGAKDDSFGLSVCLSGSTALVGATGDDDKGSHSGSAYLFLKADTNKPREIKITAPDGAPNDLYGSSVSIDGENFLVGAKGKNGGRGKAYTGQVSSLTALNEGNAGRTIEGLCFISQDDWIIGESTRGNQIWLSDKSRANVSASGKVVCIGRQKGADDNELIVAGTLRARMVRIGQQGQTTGNVLRLEPSASVEVGAMQLAAGNLLAIKGHYPDAAALFSRLGDAALKVRRASEWVTVDASNFRDLISSDHKGGYTYVTPAVAEAVPFPLAARMPR